MSSSSSCSSSCNPPAIPVVVSCTTPTTLTTKRRPIHKKLRKDDAQLSKSIVAQSSLYDAPFATPVCNSPNMLDDVHTDFDFNRVQSSPAPSIPEEPYHGKVNVSMADQWTTEKTTMVADMILHPDDHDLIQIQSISSSPPAVCIPSLIKWILEHSSLKARILAYQSTLNCLREPRSANSQSSQTSQSTQNCHLDVCVPLVSQLIPAFQRDFSRDTSEAVIHEALKLFGFILYTPKLFSQLSVNQVMDLIQRTLRVGLNTANKTTCHLSIWVLRMQRLPAAYLQSRPLLDSISLAISFALKSPTPFESTVIPTEAILVLDTLLKLLPRHIILSRASDWLQSAFWSTMSGNNLLRKHAIDLFTRHLPLMTAELSRLQHVLDAAWDRNNMRIVYELTELVGRNERDGMKMWSVSMVLWCIQMQRHGSMINGMLKIVERQFNIKRASAKLYGYRAWTALIFGSAINNSLSNERRLKLLMIPIINSQHHDRYVRLRCSSAETWMNLVYAIGCTLPTWSGNSFSIVITPVLKLLILSEEPEICSYGWTVFQSLLNVSNSETKSGNLDTQINQLKPLLNYETNPSEYLCTMQINGKWFREKVEDLLVILRAAFTEGPRKDELALSPGMNTPVMPSRVYTTFRKLLIALERVCQKDIYYNQDTINALLHVGGFLSTVVISHDALKSSLLGIKTSNEDGLSTNVHGPEASEIPQDQIWLPMDTLDLLISTVVDHLSWRLLQNNKCRFKDLEEACRMRLVSGTLCLDVFNVAEIVITPAAHLVLLWVKALVPEGDMSTAVSPSDSMLGHTINGLSSDDNLKQNSDINVLTPANQKRWSMYWNRYNELVNLTARSKNLIQAMFSTLALIEVQALIYPINIQLEYWKPLTMHVVSYLSKANSNHSISAPLGSCDSMSDIDVDEGYSEDMVPTFLLWPLCRLAKSIPYANSMLEFPIKEWLVCFTTAIDTRPSTLGPVLPHVISQTLIELFHSESVGSLCRNICEPTLTVLANVTSFLLTRLTAYIISPVRVPIEPDEAIIQWTRNCIDHLSAFMTRTAKDAVAEIQLWPACLILLNSVAETIQSIQDSESTMKSKTLIRLFEEWRDPIVTIADGDHLLCLTSTLTMEGQKHFNVILANVLSKMVQVWSDSLITSLTPDQIFHVAAPIFTVALSNESESLVEMSCRIWNERFGEIVESPLFVDNIPDDLSLVLGTVIRDPRFTIKFPKILHERPHTLGISLEYDHKAYSNAMHEAVVNPSDLPRSLHSEEHLDYPLVPGSSPHNAGRGHLLGSYVTSSCTTETDSDFAEDNECKEVSFGPRKAHARTACLEVHDCIPPINGKQMSLRSGRQHTEMPKSPPRSSPTPQQSVRRGLARQSKANSLMAQQDTAYVLLPSVATSSHAIRRSTGPIECKELNQLGTPERFTTIHASIAETDRQVINDGNCHGERKDLEFNTIEPRPASNENTQSSYTYCTPATGRKKVPLSIAEPPRQPSLWSFDAHKSLVHLHADQLKECSLSELIDLQHQLLTWTTNVNQEVAKQIGNYNQLE